LEESDLVKFAKFIPPTEEMYGAIQKARAIVDATKETILIPAGEEIRGTDDKKREPTETEPVPLE
jgi:hypothetical protein